MEARCTRVRARTLACDPDVDPDQMTVCAYAHACYNGGVPTLPIDHPRPASTSSCEKNTDWSLRQLLAGTELWLPLLAYSAGLGTPSGRSPRPRPTPVTIAAITYSVRRRQPLLHTLR